MKRTYRQNCALAHALDQVGERWTLLIVRELLTGPKRYGALSRNLPAMGTNLLASRLRSMARQNLVEKRGAEYRLTARGQMLEPVVHALIRFAMAGGFEPGENELHRREWDAVALKALCRTDVGLEGRYAVVLDDVTFGVDVVGDEIAIAPAPAQGSQAALEFSTATGRAMARGDLSPTEAIEQGLLKLHGKPGEARRLASAFGIAL